MAASTKRTPEELRAASAHLHYEVSMFDATAQALMVGALAEGVEKNVYLESLTIHTRVLLQFFFPTSPDAHDVLAAHYSDNGTTWPKQRGRQPRVLSAVNSRVGQEIAHLTYSRLDVSPKAKLWNIIEIWQAVMRLVATFVQHVPPEYLGPEWTPTTTVPTPSPSPAASATNHVTMINSISVNRSYRTR
jgi:hypothetical protein